MKIAGITRVRNEANIMQDTIEHFSKFCNAGLYVYDDASQDNTVQICMADPRVKAMVLNKTWKADRMEEEWRNRQAILQCALNDKPDWIIYFDADERIEFDFTEEVLTKYDAVRMKLYDFYITEEDVDKHYSERRWLGPEFRRIIMAYRNLPGMKYHMRDQREITLAPKARVLDAGYVRHYGKAISEQEWEDTCEYYAKNFPEPYKSKWEGRRGKAIHHGFSDFNRPLIEWHEKDAKGVQI